MSTEMVVKPRDAFTLRNWRGDICIWCTAYHANQVRQRAVEWHGDITWPEMLKRGYRVIKVRVQP